MPLSAPLPPLAPPGSWYADLLASNARLWAGAIAVDVAKRNGHPAFDMDRYRKARARSARPSRLSN